MSLIDGQTISVEEVEHEIAVGTGRLSFAQPVEAVFESASASQRLRMISATAIVATILYDIFLIADFVTLHDMFWVMVIARLGIFTPIVLLGIFVTNFYKLSTRIQESLSVFCGIIGIALPMIVMIFSESQYRLSYQYGSILIMMYCTIVQRLRFRYAVFGLACMLAIQFGTNYISGAFDAETYLGIVLFFSTSCVLMALTAYYLEHGERRSFLFALRGELLRRQIEVLARTDSLTGLFNRRHLAEIKAELWQKASSEPRTVSVILLDIDHFKVFNDSRGHLEGDNCLRTVSRCISEVAMDRRGLAFRFGGEEMLVLLPDVDLAEAVEAAEAMRRGIEGAAIAHPAIGGFVTASVGVASGMVPDIDKAALIAAADGALYAAKHAGRNRVVSAAGRAVAHDPVIQATAA